MITCCPSHIRLALKGIESVKGRINLFVLVVDARAPRTTELPLNLLRDPKAKLLVLHGKSDLSDLRSKRSFNFKDPRSRRKILSLIYEALEIPKWQKQGLTPYFQIMVIGYPNTGKSTLINLLKGKSVAVSENMPGKTRKISRFPLGNNVWLYDTPGIFFPKKTEALPFKNLFLINAIPYSINDHSSFLESAYLYLSKHYPRVLEKILGSWTPVDYPQFLLLISQRYKYKLPQDHWDTRRAEEKFLNILRSGKIRLNWERNV